MWTGASYTVIWSLLEFSKAVTRFGVEFCCKLQNDLSSNPMIQLDFKVYVDSKECFRKVGNNCEVSFKLFSC